MSRGPPPARSRHPGRRAARRWSKPMNLGGPASTRASQAGVACANGCARQGEEGQNEQRRVVAVACRLGMRQLHGCGLSGRCAGPGASNPDSDGCQRGLGMPRRWQIPRIVPRLSVECRGTGACDPFFGLHPDVVLATGVVREAPMFAKVALEFTALHARRRREAASSRSSFVLEARSARRASCAIRNASSIVSASVTSSGSTGLVTMNPPSSADVSVRTSVPSLTVYDLATKSL